MIDVALVRDLVASQFPQWQDLSIKPVSLNGWDNRTFRLGDTMLVRLPSAAVYAAQVEKEQHWLPKLAPSLPLPIPTPLAIGKPAEGYPWAWSIYRWLEGEPASITEVESLSDFAVILAEFILALERIDATGGPSPGHHNFYRRGSLKTYDSETRQAIALLQGKINSQVALEVWERALAAQWQEEPVWVHGDMSASNLLVQNGRLSAVIDFGLLTVGDPACDLAIAWTFFESKSREVFKAKLAFDADTWARGRAWVLWKSLVIASGLSQAHAIESEQCWRVIEDVLAD